MIKKDRRITIRITSQEYDKLLILQSLYNTHTDYLFNISDIIRTLIHTRISDINTTIDKT